MEYPIFLTRSEACKVLRIGNTSLHARINDGSLQTAKMGRGTRITFASVIAYTIRCLQEGNGTTSQAEILESADEVQSWLLAEHLARQLCHTHSEPADDPAEDSHTADSKSGQRPISWFRSKNDGGEF